MSKAELAVALRDVFPGVNIDELMMAPWKKSSKCIHTGAIFCDLWPQWCHFFLGKPLDERFLWGKNWISTQLKHQDTGTNQAPWFAAFQSMKFHWGTSPWQQQIVGNLEIQVVLVKSGI